MRFIPTLKNTVFEHFLLTLLVPLQVSINLHTREPYDQVLRKVKEFLCPGTHTAGPISCHRVGGNLRNIRTQWNYKNRYKIQEKGRTRREGVKDFVSSLDSRFPSGSSSGFRSVLRRLL